MIEKNCDQKIDFILLMNLSCYKHDKFMLVIG